MFVMVFVVETIRISVMVSTVFFFFFLGGGGGLFFVFSAEDVDHI